MSQDTYFRSASFKRAAINENARIIELSFSSDAPCDRGDYLEILDHSPQSVDLSRIKGGACLLDHDASKGVLGIVESVRLASGKGRATVRFSKSALAEEVWQDCLDGIRNQVSVGYQILNQIREGEDTIRVTLWRPMEISIVAVAADFSVGIGRNFQSTNPPPPTTMSDIQYSPELKAHLKMRSQETPQEHAARKIRDFTGAIRNPSWQKSALAIGERMILEGCVDFEQFRRAALETFTSEVFTDTPEPSDYRNGSLNNRGLGGLSNRSVAVQIASHPEFKRMFEGGRKTGSFTLPGVRSVREFRAINSTADFGTTTQYLPGVQGVAFERLCIADLIAPGTTGSGKITYPREVEFEPSAEYVGEAGIKAEQAFSVESIEASAKKVAAFTKISTELRDDSPASIDYIQTRLEFAVQKAEDYGLLYGDGLGANMKGIFSTGGVQTQAFSGTKIDSIRRGIGAIDINSDYMASGIALHPSDWMEIELLKDTTGRYLVGQVTVPDEFGRPRLAPAIWGLPIAVSKSVRVGYAAVGAYNQASQLYRRLGMLIEMTNCNENDFVRNLLTIIAETRAALAVYAPVAFCEVALA